jgi:hypothetical protein
VRTPSGKLLSVHRLTCPGIGDLLHADAHQQHSDGEGWVLCQPPPPAWSSSIATHLGCAEHKQCCACVDEWFLCLKRCLDDFNGHNIDIACELVEGAGAFMIRQAATAPRMEKFLDVRRRATTCVPACSNAAPGSAVGRGTR